MRPLITVLLFVGLASCSSRGATAPDATVISIRLRDDRGAPAGRNQVIVTLPTATRLDTRTQGDGTVDIGVADAGVYLVRVIPREGYVSTTSLTKTVTVTSNGTVVVDFTLYRAGTDSNFPCLLRTIVGVSNC
ncbi:MAG: hypothetical protein IPP90_13810 [Gemmatimonadaceae bacterium]|nr:hypothetical protein [Gemmatimonadaceae bacterium]